MKGRSGLVADMLRCCMMHACSAATGRACSVARGIVLLLFFFMPLQLNADGNLRDDLFSVSFPSAQEGWTCGRWGTILHTADGGQNWQPQESATDYTLSAVFFVDTRQGWAVGDQGTILHTGDGGKHWKKQKSPVPFFLMDVYFATPLRGWIVTERTHILATGDGGATWTIQFTDEDYILKALSFCSPNDGWAVGEYGYIYHTADGGDTWVKQAGYFGFSEMTGDIEGDPFLFDVVAVDPEQAWAVGIDSTLIRTVDGGASWQKMAATIAKTQLFYLAVAEKDTMITGGNGLFLQSGDRGCTWTPSSFDPPIPYGWLYGIAERGSEGFAAVGWEGAIYLSSSNTWHRVN